MCRSHTHGKTAPSQPVDALGKPQQAAPQLAKTKVSIGRRILDALTFSKRA